MFYSLKGKIMSLKRSLIPTLAVSAFLMTGAYAAENTAVSAQQGSSIKLPAGTSLLIGHKGQKCLFSNSKDGKRVVSYKCTNVVLGTDGKPLAEEILIGKVEKGASVESGAGSYNGPNIWNTITTLGP